LYYNENIMNKTKRYFIFILGLLVFGFGISLGNKSLLGGNPMSILVVGLSKHLPLSIGTCNLIVAAVEALIGYMLDKKNVTIATIIGVLCGSYFIDLANLVLPDVTSLYLRVIYMIVGINLYCLGLALQQYGKCGYGNLDCFIFGLGKLLKIEKYHNIRWITDILFIISGYLLGGIVNIGTLALLAIAGLLIEFFRNRLIRKCGENTPFK